MFVDLLYYIDKRLSITYNSIVKRLQRAPKRLSGIDKRNMYYVYAISSHSAKYIYVGISDNPERRIDQHNKGYNKTTKPYAPFDKILLEEYESRKEARKREKCLKSGFGKEFLKSL